MIFEKQQNEKRRSQMWANTSSMMEKVDSSRVKEMKNKIKNIELSKKKEEEEKQKEIKTKKTADQTNIAKMIEKVNAMANEQEKIDEIRKVSTLSSMDEKVDTDAVQRVQEDLKKKEIDRQKEEEERQKEIKRRKTVDITNMAKMKEKVTAMAHDQEKANEIRKVSTMTSMDEKVETDAVQRVQEDLKKKEIDRQKEEEERQKEIKRRKTVDITNMAKMKEKVTAMAHDQEKANEIRKVSTMTSMDEKVETDAVQRVQEDLKKKEIARQKEEEEKQKEIKRRKTVKKEKLAEINQKLDTMIQTLEETHNRRRRDSIKNSSMAEKVESFNVQRMQEELQNIKNAEKKRGRKYAKRNKRKKDSRSKNNRKNEREN